MGFFTSGVGDSIKKTAGGLFQGISESYNAVKKNIDDRQASKDSVLKFVRDYVSSMDEDKTRDLSQIVATMHKYFSRKYNLNGSDVITKALADSIDVDMIVQTSQFEDKERLRHILSELMPQMVKDFAVYRTTFNFVGTLLRTLDEAIYASRYERCVSKFGDDFTLDEVVDGLSNEELFDPYNAYLLCRFIQDKPYHAVMAKYEELISTCLYGARIRNNREKMGYSENDAVDTVIRLMDSSTILIEIKDGFLRELVLDASPIKTKGELIQNVECLNFQISLDDINFYKVEGEYHRDTITSGGGTNYLMTTAANYSRLGGSYHDDIKTEIKVEDTRKVALYTKKGTRYYDYSSLGTFEKLLPQKSNDIVKMSQTQDAMNTTPSAEMGKKNENSADNDIMKKFEQLEKLKSAGMLTDDEFEEKRKELVSRL